MCILFHDWQVVESTTEEQVRYDVQQDLNWELNDKKHYPEDFPKPPRLIIFAPDSKKLIRKVCLTCGEKVDTISAYKKVCERDFHEAYKRKLKAKELFKD